MQNEEADALTNSEFHQFRPENRINVELDKLEFLVMDALFAEGEAYVEELRGLKEGEKRKAESDGKTPAKKKKDDLLRVKDPW